MTRDDVVFARYHALQRDIAIVVLAAVAAMATQILVLKNLIHWGWSILMPLIMMSLGLFVFFYWLAHRRDTPEITVIRWRLRALSVMLVIAGVLTALGNIHLFNLTEGINRYFIIFQSSLYGFCFAFILNKIGPAAYIYNLLIIPSVIFYILYAKVEHAIPLAILLGVFEVGMLLAMRGSNQVFDNLINARFETQQMVDENIRIANHDALTNLPNRRKFFISVNEQLDTAKREGSSLAVGIIDLDNFKPINDAYGHHVGDLVLVEVAKRLSSINSETISYYRLGGDEFAFHLSPENREDNFQALGRKINYLISQPLRIDGLVLRLTVSIGVSILEDVQDTAQMLYEQSDFALYHAKRTGGGQLELFANRHLQEKLYLNKIDQSLRAADIEAEFYPLFHPIIDVSTGEVRAFESLARWNNSELKSVPPSLFIPVAESLGMIGEITKQLFKKSIVAMRNWPENIRLSFNLSAFDIANKTLVREISNALVNSDIEPSRFVFEITETALLKDFKTVREHIEQLRLTGARIALDDFGTGYSSLSHVQNMPLDKIKIDRSFIRDIETNGTSQTIVKSILALCRGMGIECVAEGAETESQIRFLYALGCTNIQGFFYSEPLHQDQVAQFIKRSRPMIAQAIL